MLQRLIHNSVSANSVFSLLLSPLNPIFPVFSFSLSPYNPYSMPIIMIRVYSLPPNPGSMTLINSHDSTIPFSLLEDHLVTSSISWPNGLASFSIFFNVYGIWIVVATTSFWNALYLGYHVLSNSWDGSFFSWCQLHGNVPQGTVLIILSLCFSITLICTSLKMSSPSLTSASSSPTFPTSPNTQTKYDLNQTSLLSSPCKGL